MDLLQETIAKTRYARYLPEYNRREDWEESCWRYINFFAERHPDALTPEIQTELANAMINLEAVGSMRALMTAGEALRLNNVAGYNCAFTIVDRLAAFSETMFVLMSGSGMGYSVEREFVNKLPAVARLPKEEVEQNSPHFVFEDSRLGWAEGFRDYINALWDGYSPTYDLSRLRPKGAPLKTFGGRSSGPEPLKHLLDFVSKLVTEARGRQLTTLECHDIQCRVAEVVVCGGVRRSALICLSNLSDMRLRDCKSGLWTTGADGQPICSQPQRQLSNNSVAYTCKPDIAAFMDEWKALYESRSGERGIFNREAATKQAGACGRDTDHPFGTNPCGEIILRPNSKCNLSEAIIRSGDSVAVVKRKVRLAAIFGTLQASLTDFEFLSDEWRKNAEEEALLGVSLTGIMDHEFFGGRVSREELPGVLEELRELVRVTNVEWAAKLGINPSKSWTCVKPSGTVSQLASTASGIHPRHAPFYLRRIRNSTADPTSQALIDAGVPWEPDLRDPENTLVFTFPSKAPEGATVAADLTAIDQLEHWLLYKNSWTTHTVSISVSVREHEWLDVAAWVYKNFDEVTGVSFFPYSDGKDSNGNDYPQLPYQTCTEEEYERAAAAMPTEIDWSAMVEAEDLTAGSQTLACSGPGGCDL